MTFVKLDRAHRPNANIAHILLRVPHLMLQVLQTEDVCAQKHLDTIQPHPMLYRGT